MLGTPRQPHELRATPVDDADLGRTRPRNPVPAEGGATHADARGRDIGELEIPIVNTTESAAADPREQRTGIVINESDESRCPPSLSVVSGPC